MNQEYHFSFGAYQSRVFIRKDIPSIETIWDSLYGRPAGVPSLLVCDANTEYIARRVMGTRRLPRCVLPPGEEHKNWAGVETILTAAQKAGLGRDGLFIGVGGGVVSDMTGFAASVYMRGASLCLVSTTLLGMVDAACGGKTGFDLSGIKNMAGTFYPAASVYMPLDCLATLPAREWKSGMAELIKTAALDEDGTFFTGVQHMKRPAASADGGAFFDSVSRSVAVKGRIVEADPQEQGDRRALLNLGHTFGHALEAAAGLGTLSHGEAVAWGMVRACELGLALGITPRERAEAIISLIQAYDYETAAPHPRMKDLRLFIQALEGDKKKKGGKLTFVVPAGNGAELVSAAAIGPGLLERIINGEQTG
jgi:3-dehydroquinate synthase